MKSRFFLVLQLLLLLLASSTAQSVTLSISPATGLIDPARVTLTATRQAGDPLLRLVTFLCDNIVLAHDSAAPYQTQYDFQVGAHSCYVAAVAIDDTELRSATVGFTVGPPASPPNLMSGQTTGADHYSVRLQGTNFAADAMVKVGTDNSHPDAAEFSGAQLLRETSGGFNYVTLTLTDPELRSVLSSAGLWFWAVNPGTGLQGGPIQVVRTFNILPTVVFIAPNDNVTVAYQSAVTFQVEADGHDDAITKVEFLRNGAIFATDNSWPFSAAWLASTIGSGQQFTAKAYDSRGATATALRTLNVSGPVASISAAPNPCLIRTGATACTTLITWNTTPENTQLWARRPSDGFQSQLASGPSGTFSMTSVTTSDVIFELRSASNILASTTARGVNNRMPVVALTAPANGAVYNSGAHVALTAGVSDPDSGDGIARVEFYRGAVLIGTDTTAPYAFDYLGTEPGTHTFSAKAFDNFGGTATSTAISVSANLLQAPRGNVIRNLPGRVEAEDYDDGGSTVAYYDTTWGNAGMVYRGMQHVDIGACADTGCGFGIGWITTGEWLEYTVNVTQSGTYNVAFRVASAVATSALHIEVDGVRINGTPPIPDTGGEGNYQTIVHAGVALTQGTRLIRVHADSGGFAFNWFEVRGNQAPGAVITAPVNGLQLERGRVTTFSVNASDADEGDRVVKVEFLDNGTVWHTVNPSPSSTATVFSASYGTQVAGSHTLAARAYDLSGAVTTSAPVTISVYAPRWPFVEPAPAIPGTIYAVEYDVGGEGVTYHDTTPANTGGSTFRGDNVDLAGAGNFAVLHRVTDTAAGEWLEYSVDVAATGTYTAEFFVRATGSGGRFHLDVDGQNVTGPLNVPAANGSNPWQFVYRPGVTLTQGRRILRFWIEAGGFDFNRIGLAPNRAPSVDLDSPPANKEFATGAAIELLANASDYEAALLRVEFWSAPVGSGQQRKLGEATTAPYRINWIADTAGDIRIWAKAIDAENASAGTPERRLRIHQTQQPYPAIRTLPARIQAEDYDIGGEGVSYHDATAGNSIATYRDDGVDISPCSGEACDFVVTAMEPGEWFEYTFDVTLAGAFVLNAHYSAISDGAGLDVQIDGNAVSGTIALPRTLEAGDFRVVHKYPIALTAGRHVLRFTVTGGGANFNWFELMENSPPTVQLLLPVNDVTAQQGRMIGLKAAARDDENQLARVEFLVTDVVAGTVTVRPGEREINGDWTGYYITPEGGRDQLYRVRARAVDVPGAQTESNEVEFHTTISTGTLRADPNPCLIPEGSSECTSRVSWENVTAPRYDVRVRRQGSPTEETVVDDATASSGGPISIDLYAGEYADVRIVEPRGAQIPVLFPLRVESCFNAPFRLTIDGNSGTVRYPGAPATVHWSVNAGCAGLGFTDVSVFRANADGSNPTLLRLVQRPSPLTGIAFPIEGEEVLGAGSYRYYAVGTSGDPIQTSPVFVVVGGPVGPEPRLQLTYTAPEGLAVGKPIQLKAVASNFGNGYSVQFFRSGSIDFVNQTEICPAGTTAPCPQSGTTAEVTLGLPAATTYVRAVAKDVTGIPVLSNNETLSPDIDVPDAAFLHGWTPRQSSSNAPAVGTVPGSAGVSGGAASYDIPIEVPPGRRGMQPALSLNYSSRSGNGVAGMGWSLSGSSSIHRCPQTLEQDGKPHSVDLSDEDRLCLDGQRLMQVPDSYQTGFAIYRTELDQYLRVTQHGASLAAGDTWFEVELKSGERQYFGSTPHSRAKVTIDNGAERTLSWNLDRRLDRAGNNVIYTYGSGGRGETVLEAVHYTGSGTQEGNRLVDLIYEQRPAEAQDRASSYLAGARIEQTLRLDRIEVRLFTSQQLVRSYDLDYGNGSGYSGRSLLRSITLCAYSMPGTSSCLPQTLFSWSDTPAPRQLVPVAQQILAPSPIPADVELPPDSTGALGEARYARVGALADFDGDGIVELLTRNATWNSAAQRFDVVEHLVTVGADRQVKSSVLLADLLEGGSLPTYGPTADLDNDGRAEIVATVAGAPLPCRPYANGITACGYRQQLKVVRWDSQQSIFQTVVLPPIWVASGRSITGPGATSLGRAFHRFADVTGDGLVDLIVQRRPWGPANGLPADNDPLAAVCRSSGGSIEDDGIEDGVDIGGPVLQVFRNVSQKTATGTTIAFDLQQPIYQRCLHRGNRDDSTGPLRPWHYDEVLDTQDYDGDGVTDLRLTRVGDGDRIRFGQRIGITVGTGSDTRTDWHVDWRIRDADEQSSIYDVPMDKLGPAVDGTDLEEKRLPNIDINGDGLLDVHFLATCGDAVSDFVQLNRGVKGQRQLLTAPIWVQPLGVAATAPNLAQCAKYNLPTTRAAFSVPADVDSDGKSEILRPIDFAARICTHFLTKSVLEPGAKETYYFCPEHPHNDNLAITGVDLNFNGINDSAFSMYLSKFGYLDDSLYTVEAKHFVELAADAAGNPHFGYYVDNNNGIVTDALGNTFQDFYGDGLDDSLVYLGCRFNRPNGAASCAPATDATVRAKCEIDGSECDWGPEKIPGTQISTSSFGAYLNENIGAGHRAGTAPQLPDLLTSVRSDSGRNDGSAAAFAKWSYQPLSSGAGRSPGSLPLYQLPASGQPSALAGHADHFYFTSSMPVVDSFFEMSGTGTWNGQPHYAMQIHQFGYREAMYHNAGRGFRGFRGIVEETDAGFVRDLNAIESTLAGASVLPGMRTLTEFKQFFPYTGIAECVASTSTVAQVSRLHCPDGPTPPSGVHELLSVERSVSSHTTVDAMAAPGKIYRVRTDAVTRWGFDPVSGKRVSGVQTDYTDDAFGNIVSETSQATDYEGTVPAVVRSTTSFSAYLPDEASWWLNRLQGQSVERSITHAQAIPALPAGGTIDTTHATTTLYNYDAHTRLPTCESVHLGRLLYQGATVPDCDDREPGWQSSTFTSYLEGMGNPTRVATRYRRSDSDAADATSRIDLLTWAPLQSDSPGYFAVRTTNAVGQSVCHHYDARFGQPDEIRRLMVDGQSCDVASDGLKESVKFDAFGREIERTALRTPNYGVGAGNQTVGLSAAPRITTARQWCNGESACPSILGNALYREVTEQQGAPDSMRYYDAGGRVLAEQTDGFDATPIFVLRKYDAMGRQQFQSTPAYGSGNAFGIYNAYDVYGRPSAKWQTKNTLGSSSGSGSETMLTTYSTAGLATDISAMLCNSVTPPAAGVGMPACHGNHGLVLNMSRRYGGDGKVLSTRDAKDGETLFWYDGAGNPVAIRDANTGSPQGPGITYASYDDAGRRLSSTDPNQGEWDFHYNGLGELVEQIDARGHSTTFTYDALGRVTDRDWSEPAIPQAERSSNQDIGWDHYEYDTQAAGVLLRDSRTVYRDVKLGPVLEQHERSYARDELFRVVGTTAKITDAGSSESFTTEQKYDRNYGRVKQMRWPGQISIAQLYNGRGYPEFETLAADFATPSRHLRRVTKMNAFQQAVEISLAGGNMQRALVTDPSTGMLRRVCADRIGVSNCSGEERSNRLLDVKYRYDGFGNLDDQMHLGQRPGSGAALVEDFQYDELHRLISVNGPAPASFGYDAVGNLRYKSDFSALHDGAYGYGVRNTPSPDDAGPNAVTQVERGNGCRLQYGYDNNGNQTTRTRQACGGQSAVTEQLWYDADNLTRLIAAPTAVTQNAGFPHTAFRYGNDNQRYLQRLAPNSTARRDTIYVGAYERDKVSGTGADYTEHRYQVAPGVLIVRRDNSEDPRNGTYYIHGDRLGSTSTVTKADGSVVDQHGFGPFGEPRNADWAVPASGPTLQPIPANLTTTSDITAPGITRRGFTEHEHLDRYGLIHMNGRTFDYQLGRFLSVDPIIQFPTNSQSLNAYSYVLNNPLAGTDPTGYACAASHIDSVCEDRAGTTPAGLGVAASIGGSNGSEGQAIAVLRLVNPESIGDPKQRAAILESINRADLFTGGDLSEPFALQPLIAAGVIEMDIYLMEGSGALLSQMQSGADLDAALGYEPNYVAVGTFTTKAGEVVFNSLPPVAYGNGLRQISNSVHAGSVSGVLIGVGQSVLAIVPLYLARPVANAAPQPVVLYKFLQGENRAAARAHAQMAQANGCCMTGVINRPRAEAVRKMRLAGTPTKPGYDRDEFPPATITLDRPDGYSVMHIPRRDNRSSGAVFGHEISSLPDGTRVIIMIPPG